MILLQPLITDIPLIGGVQVYFLTAPDIDFDLGGIANALDAPGLSNIIRKIILEQIGYFIVRFTCPVASVTRWQNCFYTIWSFTALKISPKAHKNFLSRFNILHYTKSSLKNCQIILKFFKTGKIAPYLVTLPVAYLKKNCTLGQ